MTKYIKQLILIFTIALLFTSCKENDNPVTPEPPYIPTPYEVNIPHGFPDLYIADDNPLTVEGIHLGRMLYYDSIMDVDNNRACASCHLQSESFSSSVVNSLAHLNLGWNGVYLWDGKVEGTLEDVMLFEVKDFFQTDLSQLNSHATYPQLFKNAFNVDEITYKEAAYALAQYQRTMISGNSKWDKYLLGEATLTQAEAQGYEIFFTEKGDCFHCHGTILFTDNLFHNNGLDSLPEQGRAKVTGDIIDVGKFKSPTLRNIMLTAPYMHNAKYATIEEVIDYYSEGIVWSETVDPLMKKVSQGGVHLTPQEKQNLIAFLHTLTDTTYLSNPDFSNPFQNK